jgi:hypothetical protein
VLWWYEGSWCGVHASCKPIPAARGARACLLFGVRCAGVLVCGVWFYRALVVPCGARMPLRHAKLSSQPTQPAVPADRCARKIVPILRWFCVALAAAERQPVGRSHADESTSHHAIPVSLLETAFCSRSPPSVSQCAFSVGLGRWLCSRAISGNIHPRTW